MRFSYIDALPITFIRMLTEANKSLPPLDALLDTGSNISILPLEVGKKLGIDFKNVKTGPPAKCANGTDIYYREAKVKLRMSNTIEQMSVLFEWDATVGFSSQCGGRGVLGHRECLEYYDVTFFGGRRYVSLVPNDDFPKNGKWIYKKP